MKKVLLLSLLVILTGRIAAFEISGDCGFLHVYDNPNDNLREKIGLDYSMPDFDTKRIDGKVIGMRLAKYLQFLNDNSKDYVLRSMLLGVLREQEPKLPHASINKVKIQNIRKTGDEIVVTVKLHLQKNLFGINAKDVDLIFVEGVSASKPTNELFSYISNYLR